ncbi:cytochrome o ubiquinol oxidase subunit IV [Paenibacillus lignilyticus]|uniref:Cytochrome o ubiquinol oxidase subunit IV n=1 Tax=Paenibacillus lignilyticus TaxID=1172615 RepID=A0ABS5C9S4_9BACL|nr:cytochrome o ubiquinol oxidase subunit IV [Paenibacillus lignilyticus]MBP3962180.1 cytochrome o ubiquinol oxidase subunit IV [Paenibacillus lignilyticus]
MAQHGKELHGEHGAQTGGHGSLKEYVTGFVLSIILTIIPLLIVLNHWMEGKAAVAVLLGTAVLQFVLQLVFFMHLREEHGPRYNLMTLLLGLVVVITIVIGSIWIMTNNGM